MRRHERSVLRKHFGLSIVSSDPYSLIPPYSPLSGTLNTQPSESRQKLGCAIVALPRREKFNPQKVNFILRGAQRNAPPAFQKFEHLNSAAKHLFRGPIGCLCHLDLAVRAIVVSAHAIVVLLLDSERTVGEPCVTAMRESEKIPERIA